MPNAVGAIESTVVLPETYQDSRVQGDQVVHLERISALGLPLGGPMESDGGFHVKPKISRPWKVHLFHIFFYMY